MDVVSFGDHLRADEEIDFAGMEAHEQALHVIPSSHGVAVHAADARAGEDFLQTLFALLRAGSEEVEVLAVALGAALGHGSFVTAIVTFEALADGGAVGSWRDGLVVGEGDGAVLALELFAAGAAHDDEGVSAAVEEDDGLLAAIERGLGFVDEGAGEEMLGCRSPGTRGAYRSSSTRGSGRFMTRWCISMLAYLP